MRGFNSSKSRPGACFIGSQLIEFGEDAIYFLDGFAISRQLFLIPGEDKTPGSGLGVGQIVFQIVNQGKGFPDMRQPVQIQPQLLLKSNQVNSGKNRHPQGDPDRDQLFPMADPRE